jgi:hypothetical protein
MSFSVALRNLWDLRSISFHLARTSGSFAAASVSDLVNILLDVLQKTMAMHSPIVVTTHDAIAQYSTLMRRGLGAGCPRLYGFRSGCFNIASLALLSEVRTKQQTAHFCHPFKSTSSVRVPRNFVVLPFQLPLGTAILDPGLTPATRHIGTRAVSH